MRLQRSRAVVAFVVALLVAGLAAGPAAAAVSVRWERDLTANLLNKAYPHNDAFEPIVATHPTNPKQLAVAFDYSPKKGAPCGVVPGLRISTDGGSTWSNAKAKPWAGSGRIPNWHAVIAWGPGPSAGSARLYWADTTVSDCSFTDHRLSIAYSDDLGASWSTLFVYKDTPATPAGGYPDIAVDRNPHSPNYGSVYATINWYPDTDTEPGMRVIASSDYGRHWLAAEVAPLPQTQANPFRYRIGYRLRSAPDGSLYASFCETDRPTSVGYPGRLAYGIARLNLDQGLGTFSAGAPVLATELTVNSYTTTYDYAPGTTDRERLNVCASQGLDVDPATGRVFLAVADYLTNAPAGTPRGIIRFGYSDDLGQSWSWQVLPSLPAVNGRTQSAHRPTLVVSGSTVFVGFHVLTDDPLSTTTVDYSVTVGNAYVISRDSGASWRRVKLVSSKRWNPDWLDTSRQGAGLRDRAELTANGSVFWAYGDGRKARAKPDARWGRGQIFGAKISLG
jgi:hypothetical protein